MKVEFFQSLVDYVGNPYESRRKKQYNELQEITAKNSKNVSFYY